MSTTINPIPEGFHTLTPAINVNGGADAIDFYKRAFGAVERYRMPGPGGAIMHAEIMIGNSILMLADESPQWGNRSAKTIGGTPVTLCLYVKDCDAVFNQAVAAGATVETPVTNMFWGDRSGNVRDPFGLKWMILTHVEDVTPEETARRAEAFMAGPGCAAEG
jgi:PhnB protein